jgi:hypothetical protein
MAAETYTLTMPGPMLKRGFWLYVWSAVTPVGEYLYVGRTGDNSSPNAVPPYQRMGQHLGHQKNQNALRKHLEKQGIVPEECASFHLVAHGPIFPEAENMALHLEPRDIVAAMEKALADALKEAGYNVLNTVKCRMCLDQELWETVRWAFAQHFPKLIPSSLELGAKV